MRSIEEKLLAACAAARSTATAVGAGVALHGDVVEVEAVGAAVGFAYLQAYGASQVHSKRGCAKGRAATRNGVAHFGVGAAAIARSPQLPGAAGIGAVAGVVHSYYASAAGQVKVHAQQAAVADAGRLGTGFGVGRGIANQRVVQRPGPRAERDRARGIGCFGTGFKSFGKAGGRNVLCSSGCCWCCRH